MSSDSEPDITYELAPASDAKKAPVSEAPEFDESDDDDDALMASLDALNRSRNLTESSALMKGRKDLKQGGKQQLTGGGSFQAMALPAALLRSLLQRGFTTPTPIQRAALPSILAVAGTAKTTELSRDHLCMARTGSGKTLCYLLPLLARMPAHAQTFGARALILVPTRELALQVLKVGKDLARGVKSEGEGLRWALIVGGEGLEEQFATMADNPDVIIATPGRLLHLIVEMSLDLKAVQYCVFDEADRLFELGFEEQLHEILHKLAPTRQTLLFSATLPSSIVSFAKAGLQNPKLIRLDAESKISKDLQMAYVSAKETEKEAVLLGLLRDVIRAPVLSVEQRDEIDRIRRLTQEENDAGGSTGKGNSFGRGKPPSRGKKSVPGQGAGAASVDLSSTVNLDNQTVLFVATKHHVEYMSYLLAHAGYSVSGIYGSMDQTARKIQLSRFRKGFTSILVVTDLAARGLDVPGVRNVVNYDFPNGARAFIHRVGRTARAGRTGWAYTFVQGSELPYLLDLELFLGRPLTWSHAGEGEDSAEKAGHPPEKAATDYNTQLIFGSAPRALVDTYLETFRAYIDQDRHIKVLQEVAQRGKKLYERGRQRASPESHRRAKKLVKGAGWGAYVNPIFPEGEGTGASSSDAARAALLAKIGAFTPTETVFEISGRVRGKSSLTPVAQLMKERRRALERARKAAEIDADDSGADDDEGEFFAFDAGTSVADMAEADEAQLESVFGGQVKQAEARSQGTKREREEGGEASTTQKRTRGAGKPRPAPSTSPKKKSHKDPNFYLGYEQEGANTEKGYSLHDGESFVSQANRVVYDVGGGDAESGDIHTQRASLLKWDRKTKKFVKSNQIGADNKKIIRSESGQKLPSSFNSGKYDEWQKKTRTKVPRTGDNELKTTRSNAGGQRFKHKAGVASGEDHTAVRGRKGRMVQHKSVGKAARPGSMPGGLKSAAVIRKERNQKAKRVKRSTQPRKK